MATAVPAIAAPAEAAKQREDESEDAGPESEAEDADQEPGEETDRTARRDRPAHAAEHPPEDRAADQGQDEQEREQRAQPRDILRGRAAHGRGQRLAVDHPHHAIRGRRDTAVEIAAAELWHDVLVDDAVGDGVGQRTLEAVADLDPDLSVLQRDQQQRAIVDALASELPGLRDAQRVLLDRLRLGRGDDQHRDLAALRLLERPQFRIERGDLVRRQGAREIGDRRGERGHRHQLLGQRRSHRCKQGDGGDTRRRCAQSALKPGEHEIAPPRSGAACAQVDGAGAGSGVGAGAGAGAGCVPKSTVGGFEIAPSSATVKFGLTL